MEPIKTNVIIVGAGPSGLTAAIYIARANLKPIVAAGLGISQLSITTEVENFPGFEDGIQGPELMDKMCQQATKFGAVIINEFATEFVFNNHNKLVKIGNQWYEAKSVILANGSKPKMLGVSGENNFLNKGVHTCATCDAPLPVYRNQIIYVVGGGDSSLEEALFITNFASKVVIIHRGNSFRASKVMVDRVCANNKIDVRWNTEILEFKGNEYLESIVCKNNKTNEVQEENAVGVFIAIGHLPNTECLKNSRILMNNGYITVTDNVFTNVEGVFSAGDCHDNVYRQAVTAAGFGCMAAIQCERWLSKID
jgi:thioredoxin reductase (NADPH)